MIVSFFRISLVLAIPTKIAYSCRSACNNNLHSFPYRSPCIQPNLKRQNYYYFRWGHTINNKRIISGQKCAFELD